MGSLVEATRAFFLSRFSPVTVLKGEITQGSAGKLRFARYWWSYSSLFL
ncbi:MAG: hypothetical protein MZV63_03035 [Marinilabiliales bacterium]|nr:hypothetical protein [Marinilabiliales bacterium]